MSVQVTNIELLSKKTWANGHHKPIATVGASQSCEYWVRFCRRWVLAKQLGTTQRTAQTTLEPLPGTRHELLMSCGGGWRRGVGAASCSRVIPSCLAGTRLMQKRTH
jgi:hypothetical protein